MRGGFARPPGKLASHRDVIALLRDARRYAASMRMFVTLLCSLLLLATAPGLAIPDAWSKGGNAAALEAVPVTPDASCADGSVHGTCQVVAADQPPLRGLVAAAGSSRLAIMPVAGSGRGFAPRTPPPRYVF